ncbi:MAG: tetratricopeptide repeat protein, partial [Candidatus Omnitrophica bacterium]|nr:tetratricopeptide repeat protein [Candidatus Omnitrophota bacterium]
ADNCWPYIGLGCCYRDQGEYETAEDLFRKAIAIDESNSAAYFELGKLYNRIESYQMAEDMLRKVIALEPKKIEGYSQLGWNYYDQKKYEEADKVFAGIAGMDIEHKEVELQLYEKFKNAIQTIPPDYDELGEMYRARKKYRQAANVLKQAIIKDSDNKESYLGLLALCYYEQNLINQAIETIRKIISENPTNDYAYSLLANVHMRKQESKLAESYFRKANALRLEKYNPMTRRNYRKLKDIVLQRGIKLVCVQYPMRSVDSLIKMFDNKERIIFVDNRKAFKDAVAETNYNEYFVDCFGGDFGHCTEKGNRLLAENIAQAILTECFDRKLHLMK